MGDDGLTKIDVNEITIAEAKAFSQQINNLLRNDPKLQEVKLVPIDEKDNTALFQACKDGRLLCKLVNAVKPDTIKEKFIKMDVSLDSPSPNDVFEMVQNINLVLEGAKKMGCKLVNIGAEDVRDGNTDLVLGLIWQIIRVYLMRNVNLAGHPELIRLLKPNETLEQMLNISSEEILLRWFNYHLKKGGHSDQVKNFGKDVADCTKWVALLNQVAPRLAKEAGIDEVLQTNDPLERAKRLLIVADELDCRDFTSAKDIVQGHARLNLAFTATIFNNHIGIHLPTEDEIDQILKEIEELKRKLKECHESGVEIEERIKQLEKEKQDLENSIKPLESELEKAEVAVIEKEQSIDVTRTQKNSEIGRLQDLISSGKAQIAELDKELEKLRKSGEASSNDKENAIKKQLQQIEALNKSLVELRQKKDDLEKIVAQKGGKVQELAQKTIEVESVNAQNTRALNDNVTASHELASEHFSQLGRDVPPPLDGKDRQEVVVETLKNLSSLIAAYEEETQNSVAQFQKHEEDEMKKIHDMTAALTKILGGEIDGEDVINKLKKAVELMIEKCKKQAVQIKTLEIAIEKKNQINDIYTEKIRAIVETQINNQDSGKKKKKKQQDHAD